MCLWERFITFEIFHPFFLVRLNKRRNFAVGNIEITNNCKVMKVSGLFFVLFGISLSIAAQSTDLRTMSITSRNSYLINLAREVTQNFGPGWFRESVIPSISDIQVCDENQMPRNSQLDLSKNIGRKYYIVTFSYDEQTRRKYVWTYASKVRIWADNGEPFGITFGNTYGVHFFGKSYQQWLLLGVKEEDKNFFDELTREELEKQIQPMLEMVKKSRESIQ